MNKRSVESLIKAGAFDSLPHNRRSLLSCYEQICDVVSTNRSRNLDGQMGFFDFVEEPSSSGSFNVPSMPEFNSKQLMKLEKEALGYYATGHPLDRFDQYSRLNGFIKIADIQNYNKDGAKITFIAIVNDKKVHTTKNNRTMCFASFEDYSGEIEGIVFDSVYPKVVQLINESETHLIISGSLSVSDNPDEKPKILVDKIESAENIDFTDYKKIFINIRSDETIKMNDIISVLEGNGGKEEVRICFSDTRKVVEINNIPNVNITKEIISKLVKICGKSNIILK